MRFSRELVHDDRRLADYVLGLLPEPEAERLDEASIVDDAVAARLRGIEDDLIDAYVSGTLPLSRRAPFEAFYLASPRRREKVEFARRFLAAVDRMPAAPIAVRRSHVISPLRAAAALLLLASGALLYEDVRLSVAMSDAKREIAADQQRQTSLAWQLEQARSASADAAAALERAQASAAPRERQPSVTPRGAGAGPAPVAVVLLPQTRSVGPLPTVAVSPTAERVAFDLRLESNDFPVYEVALRDPATNRTVWRSGRLTARSRGGIFAVSIGVPAKSLEQQHYSFELAGINGDRSDVAGNYVFQVDRREP